MIRIKQAVIVEGKYDKIKLDSIIDALIITTNGFEIFRDSKKMELIRSLAQRDGILILTDSDSAGFKIRSYITGSVRDGKVYNAYIPDILGKESRKTEYSKEGKLGVEGISVPLLIDALQKAGVSYENDDGSDKSFMTKLRLYEDGLSGSAESAKLRGEFLKILSLPQRLSSNSLVKVINSGFSQEQYEEALCKAKNNLKMTADGIN